MRKGRDNATVLPLRTVYRCCSLGPASRGLWGAEAMMRCTFEQHYFVWSAANTSDAPPPGTVCLCGLARFGQLSEAQPLPDGRCSVCRAPIDDHEQGRCPQTKAR